jgi:6-phosphogluconate dehydrogenase (decarboxylating)
MVPAAAVDGMLERLVPLLQADDVIIDGGNSYITTTCAEQPSSSLRASTTSTLARAAAYGAQTEVTAS